MLESVRTIEEVEWTGSRVVDKTVLDGPAELLGVLLGENSRAIAVRGTL
jgi:hypothetical protein